MLTRRPAFSLIALALALLLTANAFAKTVPTPAAEQEPAPQPTTASRLSGLKYGTITVVENVVYVPAKAVYAAMGVFVGGVTWVLTVGNTKAAKRVWHTALGGKYVLTRDMIEGNRQIEFSGPTEPEPQASEATPTPTPSAPAAGSESAGKKRHAWWHIW